MIEDDDDIQEYKRPWVGLTHGEVVDIYEAVMKADVAELVTTMLVITAVVDAGTVYSVVLDVAAAIRARALVVVAISYYLPC